MKNKYLILAFAALLFVACKQNDPGITPAEDNKPTPTDSIPTIDPLDPQEPDEPDEPGPEGSINFTHTYEQIANPERGFYVQKYYTSDDLEDAVALSTVTDNRNAEHITLYLHSYYLTAYIDKDIDPAFMERFERNMNTLRAGGAKAVLRFSYKSNHNSQDIPWDATSEWANKHIDQIAPYLQKHADVIYCVQAGFIGSWGEWYYTDNYPFNPYDDDEFEPYWEIAEHLMNAVPTDRQICFRQPQFKMRYLTMRGLDASPLTAEEAYQPTIKARWAGHNDCFVSSSSDVGTFHVDGDREFWAADTKYTLMGGESCKECEYSNATNAIKEMETYHWSYMCNSYHPDILTSWEASGHYEQIKRRLGYRFVLRWAYLTPEPKAGEQFDAQLAIRNKGFAAPANKRDLELVFVSVDDPTRKFVYPQTEDPRFWMAGELHKCTLSCTLDPAMQGEYMLYLNLPDPYPSLHDNPLYSIRLANENVWEEETGYNYLTTINVQ